MYPADAVIVNTELYGAIGPFRTIQAHLHHPLSFPLGFSPPLQPGRFILHWKVTTGTTVNMALEAQTPAVSGGWFAVGWSATGAMYPADAVIVNTEDYGDIGPYKMEHDSPTAIIPFANFLLGSATYTRPASTYPGGATTLAGSGVATYVLSIISRLPGKQRGRCHAFVLVSPDPLAFSRMVGTGDKINFVNGPMKTIWAYSDGQSGSFNAGHAAQPLGHRVVLVVSAVGHRVVLVVSAVEHRVVLVVSAVGHRVVLVVSAVGHRVVLVVSAVGHRVVLVVSAVGHTVMLVVSAVGHRVVLVVSAVGHRVVLVVSAVGHRVVLMVSAVGHTVVLVVSAVGHRVVLVVSDVGHRVVLVVSAVGHRVVLVVSAVGHRVVLVVSAAGHRVVLVVSAVGHRVVLVVSAVGHRVVLVVSAVGHRVVLVVSAVGHRVVLVVSAVGHRVVLFIRH
ncbi:unnamed protein product [Closterium sp. NIES-64]|nr:unnamed protein product [Closterium sp. NIES-64]CAI5959102.1 unnamed protein product [Closterium sp. NIES-64]